MPTDWNLHQTRRESPSHHQCTAHRKTWPRPNCCSSPPHTVRRPSATSLAAWADSEAAAWVEACGADGRQPQRWSSNAQRPAASPSPTLQSRGCTAQRRGPPWRELSLDDHHSDVHSARRRRQIAPPAPRTCPATPATRGVPDDCRLRRSRFQTHRRSATIPTARCPRR